MYTEFLAILIKLTFQIIGLIISGSILWGIFKTGVTPIPATRKAQQAMATAIAIPATGPNIVDLGSGWGNLVFTLAKHYPQRKIIGYETSFIPWLIATIIKKLFKRNNITFLRQDFTTADLSETEVITCYLFPKAMGKVQQLISNKPTAVKWLISNTYPLPNQKPIQVIQLDDYLHSKIFVYQLDLTNAPKSDIPQQ